MTLLGPLVCNYYVTLRCNDTCEFCGIWKDAKNKTIEEAPLKNVIRNLSDLHDLGIKYIDFTGGEPLLRHDIPQILLESKKKGFYNMLTTNGILFKDREHEISPYLDAILFSLDSPVKDEHDRIRGVDCYDDVIKGISLAKTKIKDVMINFSVTRDTVLFLPEMVDIAEELDVIVWVNPVFRYDGAEGLTSDSLDYILRYKGRKNVAFNMAALDLMRKGGNNMKRFPACRAASSVVTILPDDKLVLPCFYKQDFSDRIDGKLKDMYREKEALYRSTQGRFNECDKCFAWPYLNPSFLYKFDKRLFLGLFSLGQLAWKKNKIWREKKR